jgi:hypothetical protein
MDDDDRPDRPERRSDPRISTRSLVEVRLPNWDALQSVYTVNLSIGGMRLSLGSRAPIGAAVDIILTLPNGERLALPGIIANLGSGGGGDVGVRFDPLPPRTLEKIKSYVSELRAGRSPSVGTKSIPPGTLIKKT